MRLEGHPKSWHAVPSCRWPHGDKGAAGAYRRPARCPQRCAALIRGWETARRGDRGDRLRGGEGTGCGDTEPGGEAGRVLEVAFERFFSQKFIALRAAPATLPPSSTGLKALGARRGTWGQGQAPGDKDRCLGTRTGSWGQGQMAQKDGTHLHPGHRGHQRCPWATSPARTAAEVDEEAEEELRDEDGFTPVLPLTFSAFSTPKSRAAMGQVPAQPSPAPCPAASPASAARPKAGARQKRQRAGRSGRALLEWCCPEEGYF